MRKLVKFLMCVLVALSASLGAGTHNATASSIDSYEAKDVLQFYDHIVRLEREAFQDGKTLEELRATAVYRQYIQSFLSIADKLPDDARAEFERLRSVGIANVEAAIAAGEPVTGVASIEGQNANVAGTVHDMALTGNVVEGDAEDIAQVVRAIAAVAVASATGIAIANTPASR